MAADLHSLAIVVLFGHHACHVVVAVFRVVPSDELCESLAGLVFGGKWTAGAIMSLLHRPEQRLRIRVVVTDVRSGDKPEHAESLQAAL